MTPQRYQLVKRIFLDVCASSADGRAAALERACGDDAELRQEVESLIAQDARSEAFFIEQPAAAPTTLSDRAKPHPSTAPTRPAAIGRYRIFDVLGEGGMGIVYLAEQDHPRRPVALKVIRSGIASHAMMRRFEYEAEILGRLHHPGIAQIYEAGNADTGAGTQPFFAMELVRGVPLTEYVVSRNLAINERLELLARVCDAVEHAHQKGVIHRDLKPGNILVETQRDEETEVRRDAMMEPVRSRTSSLGLSVSGALSAQPKILDFGVARAVGHDPAHTMSTMPGQLIGTMAYMSPEQVAGDPHDLDTRSDVYALGVIYFEVLSGRLPHDLRQRPLGECVRIIREQDTMRLSAVDRTMHGDLETIVGKALERDRGHRYQSAAELAADTRRFLADQPITARPPSAIYQIRKFAKRNRAMVGGGALAAATIMIAALLVTWQGSRAATERQQHVEIAGNYASELQANLTPLDDEDPLLPPARRVQSLDLAAGWLERKPRLKPLEQAKLRHLVGLNYLLHHEYEPASQQLTQALDIRRRNLPDRHPEVAESLHSLGRVLWWMGEYDRARAHYEGALAMRIALFGQEHEAVAMTITHLAACDRMQGDYQSAVDRYERGKAIRIEVHGANDPWVAASENALALCLAEQGRHEEAAAGLRHAWSLVAAEHGANDLRVASGKAHEAACLIELRRFDEADTLLAEALETQTKLIGEQKVQTAATLFQIATLRRAQRRSVEAKELATNVFNIQQAKLGDHLETAASLLLLGSIDLEAGDALSAEPRLRRALGIRLDRLPPDHWQVAQAQVALGSCLVQLDRSQEALALLSTARATFTTRGVNQSLTRSLIEHLLDGPTHANLRDEARMYQALVTEHLE